MKYIFEDFARFAEAYGLEINMGPLADTGKACRGFLFAERSGKGKPCHDRIFQALWLEGGKTSATIKRSSQSPTNVGSTEMHSSKVSKRRVLTPRNLSDQTLRLKLMACLASPSSSTTAKSSGATTESSGWRGRSEGRTSSGAENERPMARRRDCPRAEVKDDNVTRDIAATYREIRLREGDHLPAYQAAVRVYKGHHPTVSDAAAREAVNKILTAALAALPDRKRGS